MNEDKTINETLSMIKYPLIGNALILIIIVLLRILINKDVFISKKITSIFFTILPLASIMCFVILVAYLLNTCFRNKSITRKKALTTVISSYVCIIFTFASIYSLISFFSDASSSYGEYCYYSKEFNHIGNNMSELEKKKIISNLDFYNAQYAFSGIKNKFFYTSTHPTTNLLNSYEQYRIKNLSDTTLSGKQKLLWYYYNAYKYAPNPKAFFSSTTLSEYASAYIEYLYFSMITITTVGYGDIIPTSNSARLLTSMEILIGQVIIVIAIALVISNSYDDDNYNKHTSHSKSILKFKSIRDFVYTCIKNNLYSKLIFAVLIVLTILLIIIMPKIIDASIFKNSLFSGLGSKDWISFLGSYLGGIIGGIATLITIYISINKTNQIQANNTKRQDILEKRERVKDALAILPYITFQYNVGEITGEFRASCSTISEDKSKYTFEFIVKLKNIGKSIASLNAYEIRTGWFKNDLPTGENFSFNSNLYDIINIGEIKKIYMTKTIEFNHNEENIRINGISYIIVNFEDIFKNKYSQLLTVVIKDNDNSTTTNKKVLVGLNVMMPEILELSKPEEIIGSRLF